MYSTISNMKMLIPFHKSAGIVSILASLHLQKQTWVETILADNLIPDIASVWIARHLMGLKETDCLYMDREQHSDSKTSCWWGSSRKRLAHWHRPEGESKTRKTGTTQQFHHLKSHPLSSPGLSLRTESLWWSLSVLFGPMHELYS